MLGDFYFTEFCKEPLPDSLKGTSVGHMQHLRTRISDSQPGRVRKWQRLASGWGDVEVPHTKGNHVRRVSTASIDRVSNGCAKSGHLKTRKSPIVHPETLKKFGIGLIRFFSTKSESTARDFNKMLQLPSHKVLLYEKAKTPPEP